MNTAMNNLTDDERMQLSALEQLLDMTGETDWHLFHNTVREKVAAGVLSREFEQWYATMVDRKVDALCVQTTTTNGE